MFKERFIKICNEKGIAPTFVCKEIGLSSAIFSQWDENSVPRATTLYKLADYLGVTVEYLKGEEPQKEKASPASSETLKEYVVFHRDGKNVKVKFTPEQQKIFDALVASTKIEDADN